MSLILKSVTITGGLSMTGGSGSGPVVTGDPYFNEVTLLAQFQGTNGSQTFVDSSLNNLTMGVSTGNPTISTAQHTGTSVSSLYSTPANLSSVVFNNNTGAVNFTGDFTIEAWTYLLATGSYPTIMRVEASAGYFLLRANGGNYEFDMNGTSIVAPGATANAGKWAHIAACRSGSTVTLYVNGVSIGTTTKSGTVGGTGGTARISYPAGGEYWNGYLQDVRVTKGVARYSGTFTPPTTLFPTNEGPAPTSAPISANFTASATSISQLSSVNFTDTSTGSPLTWLWNFNEGDQYFNDVLLLLKFDGSNGSTTFTDNSKNNYPFVANSTAAITTSAKKYGTGSLESLTRYQAGVKFNPTAWNAFPSPADNFVFSTKDFTIESWVNVVNIYEAPAPIFCIDNLNNVSFCITSDMHLRYYDGSGSIDFTSTSTFNKNEWHHVAITRHGSTFTFWIDGISSGTATSSAAVPANNSLPSIGALTNGNYGVLGYIDDFRLTMNVARYTSNFTVPGSLPINGTTSTLQNPTHTYNTAGTYGVTLTAGGTSTKTVANMITVVNGAPTANFTSNVTSGDRPLLVSFTDTSTNTPTGWLWNFGDGNTSTSQSPSHTYSVAGTYTVSLTVSNDIGNDTKTVTNMITVAQGAVTSARYWRLRQDTITGGGNNSTQWHLNSFSMTGTFVSDNSAASATTSNTTASSIRGDSSLSAFFSSSGYGIFGSPNAGENLLVDFGAPVAVTTATVRNAVGAQWAPTGYSIQYSTNNVDWTTTNTVVNDGANLNVQTVSVQ